MTENQIIVDDDGLELETEETQEIIRPFDPAQIRVETKLLTIDILMQRIKNDELDLMPDFQRGGGIWTSRAKSRLIESMLIRIPIPVFYFDATDDDKWLVVDGLQRLGAFRDFILGDFRLTDMEFLTQLNNKAHADLPRNMQRRINETQLTAYLIEKGTPPSVKLNIFKRINTGGLPLSSQEIRHALNPGPARRFLEVLAQSSPFREATDFSLATKRMADRECVLRFSAFMLKGYKNYGRGDWDLFLNNAMGTLNTIPGPEVRELAKQFMKAMNTAAVLFREDAFRKPTPKDQRRRAPINKALFEAWSVNLANLDSRQTETLISRREILLEGFNRLMDENGPFVQAISLGTSSVKKVQIRFSVIEELIRETLA